MSKKKKNALKSKILYCLICGFEFNNLEEKQGHRINPKKGNSENNLVIMCKKCKKIFQKNSNIKIHNIQLNKEIKHKYFKCLERQNARIILDKIRMLRRINYDKIKAN